MQISFHPKLYRQTRFVWPSLHLSLSPDSSPVPHFWLIDWWILILQHSRDGGGAQYSLPDPRDSHNDTLDTQVGASHWSQYTSPGLWLAKPGWLSLFTGCLSTSCRDFWAWKDLFMTRIATGEKRKYDESFFGRLDIKENIKSKDTNI